MPYIKQSDRYRMSVTGGKPTNAGELNYAITLLLIAADVENEALYHGVLNLVNGYANPDLNYQRINDCLGAMMGAGAEYMRRVGTKRVNSMSVGAQLGRAFESFYNDIAATYENEKCKENGDVY